VELLRCETPAFVAAEMWPPNSPDLNRVNYRIWRVMQEQLCQTLMQVLAELRQRVTSTWAGFQQIVVDETVDQRRKRLDASVRAQGRHFYRATLCVSAVFALARCLSVCLSVTLVHSIHTAKVTVKLLCRSGSPSF